MPIRVSPRIGPGALFVVSSIALALLVLGMPISAGAQQGGRSPVELAAAVGFNGAYVPGEVTPVRVRLDYQGDGLSGELVLRQTFSKPLGESKTMEVRRPVSLGSSARKRFEFYLPLSDSPPEGGGDPRLIVRFVAQDRVMAERTVELTSPQRSASLVLMLATSGYLSVLPTGEQVEQLDVEHIPSDWRGLSSVERIYLARVDTQGATSDQRRALTQWLARGGELVVLAGENAYLQDAAWLAELLPFRLHEVRPAAELGLRMEGRVTVGRAAGRIVYRAGHVPLLIRGSRGQGVVVYSALALSGASEVEQAIWTQLDPNRVESSAPSSIRPEAEGMAFERPELGRELFAVMTVPYPSKLWFAGLLTAYVAGIGLLSLWMLRRSEGISWGARESGNGGGQKGRGTGWRVLLVMLIGVGAMTGGTLAYLARPAFTNWAHSLEMGVIWGEERTAIAHEEGWYSVLSKRRLSADWSIGRGTMVLPQGASDLLLRVTSEGQRLQLPAGELSQRRQEDFYYERFRPLGVRVQFEQEQASVKMPQVRVYNKSRWQLEDAVIVWRSGGSPTMAGKLLDSGIYYLFGDLAPGKAREMGLSEVGATSWLRSHDGNSGTSFERRVKRALFDRVRARWTGDHEWVMLAWVRQDSIGAIQREHRRVLKLLVLTSESEVPKGKGT